MSDVDDNVAGDVIAAPDETFGDDDDDTPAVLAAPDDDDEPDQAEASYAADDEYKDDPEPEPEPEPEPSSKAAPEMDEEPSYADDFEQSMVASKMPGDEDRDGTPAAIDEPVDDDEATGVAAAGAALLAKSSSVGSRVSSAAGSRPGSSSSAAPPAKPAAAAPKPAAAVKPAAAATKPAAVSKPAATPAPKPAAPLPKSIVPVPKPAVPRAPPAAKPAAPKPAPPPAPVVSVKPAVPARNMAPPAAPAVPPPTAVGPGGQKVKLTFTGPPNTSRAAPTTKPDYSHSSFEVKKIGSDNMKLCNRLVEISRATPNPAYTNTLSVGSAAVSGKLAPANVAASTVNRHKKEDKIAQENLALYKRLQAVKPSKDINREGLNKDFAKTQAYGDNARKVKSVAPPPAAANVSAAKLAASGVARQPAAGSAEAVYSRTSPAGSVRASSAASGSGAASGAAPPPAAGPGPGMDLSTVSEGAEGAESSDAARWSAAAAAPPLEPEYSMDPEFDQAPSQSFS